MTQAKTTEKKPAAAGERFNLAKMKNARFEGFSRAHLIQAAELLLSASPDDDESDSVVIDALCAACNMPRRREGGEQISPGERAEADAKAAGASIMPQPKIRGMGKIPNLSSTGRWEGRRRRVQFALADNPEGTIALGWDANQKWTIQTPDIVNMPWPYWVRVRDSVLVDDRSNKVRKFKHDDDGKLYVTTKPKKKNVYNYVDLGDVEGTENLPLSYWDFFRGEAMKNDCFKGFPRQALIMVYNKLRDQQTSKFFEGKDNDAVRRLIAEILDPSLVTLMDEEAYGDGAINA